MNKYLKLANYFDSQGYYKSADALEALFKKAQNNSFIDKQPDLAKIEKSPSNKIANDIVYYAASISQGTKTPSYDPKSFFTTIQKLESMKMNPNVQTNFPNIYNALDSAIELLKSKSVGQTPQTPGETPGSAPLNPQNPESPENTPNASSDDINYVRKIIGNMKRYIKDLKRWKKQKADNLSGKSFSIPMAKIDENIVAYTNLLEDCITILRSKKYKNAVDFLVSIGEFNPDAEIPESAESITPDTPDPGTGGFEKEIAFIRKTYIDLKRYAEYDIPRHKRDLELLDPEKEQDEIRKKKQIINNYLALIDKNILILKNPAYKRAVEYLVRKGEISLEEAESEASSDNPATDASKILDEAFPTYSSRPKKPDERLPGDRSRADINFDYFNKFDAFDGPHEKDPAGGPKLTPEQLRPFAFSFGLPETGFLNKDKEVVRNVNPVKF